MSFSGEKFPTRFWYRDEQEHIVCTLCPRLCHLREGKRGVCYVRQAINGQIVLNGGITSGLCVDPIEKKPLFHFLPGTPVLSFGTQGCNLTCRFCQNWQISKSRESDTLNQPASATEIAHLARKHSCPSVAFTYNDPVIFMEYALEVSRACHQLGIKTVAVTAGYINPEPRVEFYAGMDAANIDLKGFSESFYHRMCGGHLSVVLETLRYVYHQTPVWLELTTLLIPGENDSDEELIAECEWIARELGPEVPLHFTAFHPDFHLLDKPTTSHVSLCRARELALKVGLKHVYIGNQPDLAGENSYCANCGELLIRRAGYRLVEWHLDTGKCPVCGKVCAGVFDPEPGEWGSRRLRIITG
jgi:Pyruvate-formate lyase-activating enzyme